MRIVWALVLLFGTRYAVDAWFEPLRDADIAWQQWLGLEILRSGHLPHALGPETFTSAGAVWVPQEWLLSVAVALGLGNGTFGVLALFAALAGAVTLALTGLACRRLGASNAATAICVAFAGFAMIESDGVRAQAFAWPFLAAFLFILRFARGPARLWLVPVTVLWANVHGSVLLAPVLLGLWTVGAALEERRWNRRVGSYAALTAAAAIALCCTPLGVRLPFYAVELWGSPIRSMIQEWQPSSIASNSFAFGFLPLFAAGALAGVARKKQWTELFLFAAASYLAFASLRHIPIGTIIIAPLVAERITRFVPDTARVKRLLQDKPAVGLLYAAAVFTSVLIVFSIAHHQRAIAKTILPRRAIARAAQLPGTRRILCEDWAWCSLALSYGNLRTFMDGRCDPFPMKVWRDQETVYGVKPGWARALDRDEVNTVVATRGKPLAQALASSPKWRPVYTDSTYELFTRVAS